MSEISLRIKAGQQDNRISFDDFTARSGECWHILGQNGAGKSSLLLILAGLLGKHQLSYFNQAVDSIPIHLQAKVRCFLYQQQKAEFDIPLRQLLSFYTQHQEIPVKIESYLHLNELLDKPLTKLSGGQQQRFHIARCLLQVFPAIENGKAIIILDEPIAQLDVQYQMKVLELLRLFSDMGNVVIMSCHEINHSIQYASHALLLKSKQVFKQGVSENVLSQINVEKVFEHTFTSVKVDGRQKNFLIS